MVYIVTNRNVNGSSGKINFSDVSASDFGSDPADLRFLRVDQAAEGLYLYPDDKLNGSRKVFLELQNRMAGYKRDCLVFVHGFNNSFEDAVKTACDLENQYQCEVVLFTWPSDGVLKYRDCKRRAVLSVPAFDRMMEKLNEYLGQVTPENACGQKINLMCHSMGNYVLANHVMSDFFNNEMLIFHNVNLVAADINNEGHEKIVERIVCRGDINIFINEDDIALDISDTKRGEAQKVRLGNYLKNLVAKKAHYYNITDAKGIWKQHNYYHDDKVLKDDKGMPTPLKKVFNSAFTGKRVSGMKFHPGLNFYAF